MLIKKINGIKSVDFKVEASGFGVVNWNGNMSVYSSEAGITVSNHRVPKLKNFDIFKRKEFINKDNEKINTIKSLSDDDFSKAKVFISQNCIRHYLFRDEFFGVQKVNNQNVDDVLSSLSGLIRGFVIAEGNSSFKRKSSLFLEDFLTDFNEAPENNGNVYFEQFTKSGERNNTSIYSNHNTKNVLYEAYGSISIEDLQFIPLENSFDRSAYKEIITIDEGNELADKITSYLKSYILLDEYSKLNPLASFGTNFVRLNSISKIGEAGIILNNDAILIIVNQVLEMFKELNFKQGRGSFKVDNIVIDYNDSNYGMRIKDCLSNNYDNLNLEKEHDYAIYYENIKIDDSEFNLKMKKMKDSKSKDKKNKNLEKSNNNEDIN